MKRVSADIVVIGSGIAGLSYALNVSHHGSVAVVTKKRRADSNTNWAQGGLAAVLDPADSVDLHARDTLVAGCGLCVRSAVDGLVREGPARVRELVEWGVRFTRRGGSFSLGREGGHSHRRIVHAEDLTGREIESALLAAISDRGNVELYEDHIALDLVVAAEDGAGRGRCRGIVAYDHANDEWVAFESLVVMLAAGGIGQVYRHTTNPDIATGDGVAMARRAGADVANLEFVQFHPTALYPADEHAFLISEAVRGEGAVLQRRDGSPLMEGIHQLGSLAPRDIVARAIHAELKRSGDPFVELDLSPIGPATIERRFPGILSECAARGIDITREPVPVVPAAHYGCGGIVTDADGRTTIPGLYAAGEVACTGVHGANRLASNSLLEAVVYSHRAAAQVPHEMAKAESEPVSALFAEPAFSKVASTGKGADVRESLRRVMWEEVGIVRDTSGLERAADAVADLRDLAVSAFTAGPADTASIELRNLCETASLIIECARLRRESRGLHCNLDHPWRDNEHFLRDTVLTGGDR
jgi:L-aspartate oxidase